MKQKPKSIVKKYRVLFFAIIILSVGSAMWAVGAYFGSIFYQCPMGSHVASFGPDASIIATCPVQTAFSGKITFTADVAWQPSVVGNLVIQDPDGLVLVQEDFSDKITRVITVTKSGSYTAKITNVTYKHNGVYTDDSTKLMYSFGSAQEYQSYGMIGLVGNMLTWFGIIFCIITAIKAARGKRSSLILD
jgi:hypothetical protein